MKSGESDKTLKNTGVMKGNGEVNAHMHMHMGILIESEHDREGRKRENVEKHKGLKRNGEQHGTG